MIEIQGVSKSFGALKVLDDIRLRIEPGEFFCLLGPSGCGKTTLLRLVAGLEQADTGTLHVGGKDVTSAPPHQRGCAMVFQSYALWPHLTVAENITYGLEVRKLPSDEVKRVLAESLKTYHLEGLGRRHPHQLSGGQQQRVALARAMAMGPEALLMDEPLSNLDAALRKSLRRELLDFHRRSRSTILYVTHDQEEAMALSDRIALLMGGKLVEVGKPLDMYSRPARLETALFLGDMNVLRGRTGPDGKDILCIRPEKVRLKRGAAGPEDLAGTVRFTEFLGTHAVVSLETAAGPLLARVPPGDAGAWKNGETVTLELPPADRLWYKGGKA